MAEKKQGSVFAVCLLVAVFGTGCSSLGVHRASAGKLPDSTSGVRQASYESPTGEIGGVDTPSALPESKPSSFKLDDLSPANLSKTFEKLTGRGPNQQAAQKLYAEAQELYRQAVAARAQKETTRSHELFSKAATRFSAAAERWPDSALEEDALFFTAESHFFADRYVQTTEDIELLIKKYPNTRYLDAVGARRFLIAKYWLELDATHHDWRLTVNLTDPTRPRTDTFGYAIRVLDKMRLDDPLGKLADDATLAAGNAYFARGDFIKADSYYTDLRTSFPSSEHQFMAHFLGIKAKLESYQGPDYGGTVLDDAEKLIQQTRRQFPTETRQHAEEIDRAEREVRYRKAEREWYMAQYYAWRHEYRAARFYLALILKKYSDTPFADKARKQLAKISGKPAEPPQKLAWLVKLFPDGNNEKPIVAAAPAKTTRR